MHAFDVLGDPVRRRLLELLADHERSSGDMTAIVQREFGLTQPAVSQHLKVLRDSGFASVRVDGSRRIYAVQTEPIQQVDVWLDKFRIFWAPKLEALATEVARGKRQRRHR
jgi:DNA-binding transcriptional ArsR family regulator